MRARCDLFAVLHSFDMDSAKDHRRHSLSEVLLFAKNCLLHPRKVGSICPSSPALGRAMVSFLKDIQQSTVIELGPGTGSITRTLLESNINLEDFYACEISSTLVKYLQERFPKIHVREGDASELTQIFKELVGNVDCIFSGLPLKSLPSSTVDKIIDQKYEILKPRGTIVQFTYDLRPGKSILNKRFRHIGSKVVVANFPPARVDAFIKE